MLSGIASYLFGASTTEEPQQDEAVGKNESGVAMETDLETVPADLDWEIVEYSDCAFGKHSAFDKSSHVTNVAVAGYYGDTSDSASSSPKLPSTRDSSLSPSSHSRYCLTVRTKHGISTEAWLLTPPPCFTAGSKDSPQVPMSPMENLLIEHPSMSVYKRSGSAGESSDISESSSEQSTVPDPAQSRVATRSSPRRSHAVSARAQLLAQVATVKVAQRVKHQQASRPNSRKAILRANKVKEVQSSSKSQSRRNRVRCPSGQMNGRVSQRKQ